MADRETDRLAALPFGPHVERDGHPRLTYWASDVNAYVSGLLVEIEQQMARIAALEAERDARLTPAQVRERIEARCRDSVVQPDDVLALFPDQEEKK